jgi:uncharacterized protein (DUF433 family)
MELENFFDFSDPTEIRVRGTRIGIETLLEDYLEGTSAEEIAARYKRVTLEEVYATILYYHHKREEIDAYMKACRDEREQAWIERENSLPSATKRLRELKQRRTGSTRERLAP